MSFLRSLITLCLLLSLSGCLRRSGQPEVIVYTALDREFSEPIFKQFEKETGIHVRPNFDFESTKTVGLVNAIIAESERRTRCDVFWNNEIVNTLRLDELGLLDAYRPAEADSFPSEFCSAENQWFGFAARARVLIVNTEVVPEDERPDSIYDLLDPKWKGKTGIAKPLFGTTASHAACLFEALGEAKAEEFFDGLVNNDVQILSGNKQVAEDVASGRLAFGLTDTDDAMIELEDAHPVAIVYPDSKPGEIGTLFIPNTISILRDAPHPQAAKKLVDYLLTAQVETKLAQGKSAQIPLHSGVQLDLRVETPKSIHAMNVEFKTVAKQWGQVREYLSKKFSLASDKSSSVK